MKQKRRLQTPPEERGLKKKAIGQNSPTEYVTELGGNAMFVNAAPNQDWKLALNPNPHLYFN